jgi:hypothetical protein
VFADYNANIIKYCIQNHDITDFFVFDPEGAGGLSAGLQSLDFWNDIIQTLAIDSSNNENTMQITGAAVTNVQHIAGFLDKLYNKTAKVNIALMGDSTTVFGGFGWDAGIVEGLLTLGLQRHGTGLVGAGEIAGHGHGHKQAAFVGNAVPSTVTTNGFTSGLPSEWIPYLSNWGTDVKSQLTQDSYYRYIGAVRPYCVTAGNATLNSNINYEVHGEDTSFSRSFEGLSGPINIQHWYLKRNAATTTGGSISSVNVRKNSDRNGFHAYTINNFNGVQAFAQGATFSFTFGLTTTDPIGLTTNTTNLQNSINAAVSGAGFPGIQNSTVTSTTDRMFSGDFSIGLIFSSNQNFPSTGKINLSSGITGRFYDNILYQQGVTTQTTIRATGGFYELPNTGFFSALTNTVALSEANKTLNSNKPQHLELATFSVAANSNRNYGIGLMWGGVSSPGISGPWCSMFNACSISGATQGFSTTTVLAMGGMGAGRHARAIKQQTYDFLGTVFQAMAQHAGYTSAGDAPLLIRIVGGVNDQNDANVASVGPSGGLSGNTRDGIRDNWQAIINHVHETYDYHGWTANNVYWLVTPSPPTQDGNANLLNAQLAAIDIANNNPRAAAVNLFTIAPLTSDFETLSARSSINDTIDSSHHTYTGYRVYSQYEWSSIQAAYNSLSAPTNTAPVARINVLPSTDVVDAQGNGETFTVSGLSSSDSDGDALDYAWTTSTGLSAVGPTASFVFNIGTRTVTLKVTDTSGATGATSATIIVRANAAPVARIVAIPGNDVRDTDGNGTETIVLSATSSSDSNDEIQQYLWSVAGATVTGPTTSFAFPVGITSVGLMVTDTYGATSATSASIIVRSNTAPTAIIDVTPSTTVTDNDGNGVETLYFSGSRSSDSYGGTVVGYNWYVDGVLNATGVTASAGLTVGSHTIVLVIFDNAGASGNDSTIVTVEPQPTVEPLYPRSEFSSMIVYGGKIYTREQFEYLLKKFYGKRSR